MNAPVSRTDPLRLLPADEPARYVSREACEALFKRVLAMTTGGGDTSVTIESNWRGNLRWARNRVTTSGDSTDHTVMITRNIRGAMAASSTNKFDDASLKVAVQSVERLVQFYSENPDAWPLPDKQQYLQPDIWSDASYTLGAPDRSAIARGMTEASVQQQLLAAGYLQVGVNTRAIFNTLGLDAYYAATTAQCSLTVRNAGGSASGWAGISGHDWKRIDTGAIADVALKKCVDSANPKAVEPGRYTVILEPQAVHDLMVYAIYALDRYAAENMQTVYTESPGLSKIGRQVFDRRITLSTDPMDPDGGYIPFDYEGYPYRAVKWVDEGFLRDLSYHRSYALAQLGHGTPLPNPSAYRMSGGSASIQDMIASTERGLLVTRFNNINILDYPTLLCSGVSRDGLWLIERGKITTPVKNMRFIESPMFVFNNVEEMGVPVRVFAPGAPATVPPVKVRDFNFSSTSDAV